MKTKRKGFTLIELLITISVIGVLVLLAAPNLLGYTDKAKLSEITSNTKEVQSAAERYYLDNDDWPRLSDDPYTKEEIENFTQEVYDITGKNPEIDPDGNYYDIDFDKLKPYIDVPGKKSYYILQNPVGKVFYLNEPTEERENIYEEKLIANKPTQKVDIKEYDGLEIWLDASTIEGENNSIISTWKNLSGNNRHFSQSTANRKPSYLSSGLNGKPAVSFKQYHDMSTSFDTSSFNGVTMIAVYYHDINSQRSIPISNYNSGSKSGIYLASLSGEVNVDGRPYGGDYIRIGGPKESNSILSLRKDQGKLLITSSSKVE